MAHSVEYVLDIPGRAFLDGLGAIPYNDERWEGTIPGTGEDLLGDIDGLLTPMTLAGVKLSWLIAEDAESLQRVHHMDKTLCRLFPKTRIVRLDELLLNEWIQIEGEYFHKLPGVFDGLVQWLNGRQAQEDQEYPEYRAGPKHWEVIQNNTED